MDIPIHEMICPNCGATLAVYISPIRIYSLMAAYAYLDPTLARYYQKEVKQDIEAYEREIEESGAIETMKAMIDGFMDSRTEMACPKCNGVYDPLDVIKKQAWQGEKELLAELGVRPTD